MKKAISIFMTLMLTMAFTACSSIPNTQEASSTTLSTHDETTFSETTAEVAQSALPDESMPASISSETQHILVAYFPWADNAVIDGEVDAVASPSVTAPGHVAQLASWIQEETGGDLFSIQVTEPYSSDWDECLARANEERAQNARPELTETVENMERYDVVFLGYPNWWYGAPMALLSFVEENDLSDKQIYLFCSHGTGGLAGSVEDIESALPDSAVVSDDVFDVYEEDAYSAQHDILNWLSNLEY